MILKEVKASTAKGKELMKRALCYDGYNITDVYKNPSYAKIKAYESCWEEFCKNDKATDFSICSHNTFSFSVSWVTENAVIYVTSKNKYKILLEV